MRLSLATLILLGVGRASLAAALHTDDFQAGDLLGWSGGAALTVQPSGGPAGAADRFLQVSNPLTNLATRNSAAAWTGDYAAIGAQRIRADLMVPATQPPLTARVVLFGPTSTSNRWTSAAGQLVPNDGQWRHYVFSLAQGDLALTLGSGTYASLMTGVVQVMLRHDPSPAAPAAGAGILSIDNVRLAAVPEPRAALLALLVVAAGRAQNWGRRCRRPISS